MWSWRKNNNTRNQHALWVCEISSVTFCWSFTWINRTKHCWADILTNKRSQNPLQIYPFDPTFATNSCLNSLEWIFEKLQIHFHCCFLQPLFQSSLTRWISSGKCKVLGCVLRNQTACTDFKLNSKMFLTINWLQFWEEFSHFFE